MTLPAVGIATYAAVTTHGFSCGVDDAQISFVYASHLARGHGFVFNVGGERVEGFSSLLWVLLTAPMFYLPGPSEGWILGLSALLSAVSYMIAVSCLLHMFAPVAKQASPVLAGITYIALLVAWPAHVTWMSASLMETALWSVCLTSATVLILSKTASLSGRSRSSAAFASVIFIMLLTRPESLLLGPLLILMRFARIAAGDGGYRLAVRLTVAPMVVLVLAVASLTTFRLWYFGYPLPNTYYAKVSPSWTANLHDGLSYLNSFVSAGPLLVLILFSTVSVVALTACALGASLSNGTFGPQLRRILRRDAVVLVLVSCVLLMLPVLSGGDHFGWWRMYQPAYPVLLLTIFVLARDVLALSRVRWSPLFQAVLAIVIVVFGTFRSYDRVTWFKVQNESPIEREFRIGREGLDASQLLSAMFSGEPREPSVAVVTAGGIKRFYRGTVLDMMGLNSIAMAHSAGDRSGIRHHSAFNADVFFAWAPDIVWPVPQPGPPSQRTRDFVRAVLHGLPDNPRFRAVYREAVVSHEGVPGRITAYFSVDFLEHLSRDPAYRTVNPD